MCYKRVEDLEKKINSRDLPESKKSDLQRELVEVRKLLSTNEEQLSGLHKQNMKSFYIVVAFAFVCFAVYLLYILVEGRDF